MNLYPTKTRVTFIYSCPKCKKEFSFSKKETQWKTFYCCGKIFSPEPILSARVWPNFAKNSSPPLTESADTAIVAPNDDCIAALRGLGHSRKDALAIYEKVIRHYNKQYDNVTEFIRDAYALPKG